MPNRTSCCCPTGTEVGQLLPGLQLFLRHLAAVVDRLRWAPGLGLPRSAAPGLAQKPRVPAGGPADAVEVLPIAPTEYHIPTQFDDLLASSSFAASSRRMTSSNKGLHSHYTSNRWMHGASPGMPIAAPAPLSFLRPADAARQTRRTGRGPGVCHGYRVSRRLVSTGSRKPAHVAVLDLIAMTRPAQAVRATSRKRSLPAARRHPALPPAWRTSSTCARGKRWCRTRAPDICTKLRVELLMGSPIFVTRCVSARKATAWKKHPRCSHARRRPAAHSRGRPHARRRPSHTCNSSSCEFCMAKKRLVDVVHDAVASMRGAAGTA